ncbi:MAG: hypothetical protein ACRCT7_01375 [Shewanella sp.]|uniref:hypothetical protein n=1 Tax=Shewanella sp. SNU WT4 TaxID=2590015 RepID=UPI001126049C|nr:hypothetical protein [Shewanella sp. SNU WT4]QDF67320.1 hypothetical protein FJQ87_11995 [Shewanella sp. SNU WT4]
MVYFDYFINQQALKIEASNWCGLERVLLNGKVVSSKFNFTNQSQHNFELLNGQQCSLTLHLDPVSQQLRCRIYKNQHLLTSLVPSAEHLKMSQKQTKQVMVISSLLVLLTMMLLMP